MKSSLKSWLMVSLAIVSFFVISAFEPQDMESASCLTSKDSTAVKSCEQFKGEGAGTAKNVILLIGDGMGIGQTYAGRVYINGPDRPLRFETLPHQGLTITCSASGITDSAASGTAFATGHKTSNATISMDAEGVETFPSILEQVKANKASGLVSTTSVWDATPAVFVSHVTRRSMDSEIARQIIEITQPEVLLGGGGKAFTGENSGVDLVAKARGFGYHVIKNKDDLARVDSRKVNRLLGLFTDGSMSFEADRGEDSHEPHLADMAAKAIDILANDPRGFFLLIEGARIDHACHATSIDKLIKEMEQFDKAVNIALDFQALHPDTLVIVTADHETGGIKVMPGNYKQGDKIKALWTTSVVPGVASHSSQMVPIYGIGPNASAIIERMDNTGIYCVMRNAFPAEIIATR